MLGLEKSNAGEKDKVFLPIITALSIAIPLVVVLLMYMPRKASADVSGSMLNLPLFHAVLNGSTALCLVIGYYFIRRKQIILHRTSMLTAFVLSSVFLISYVTYHYAVPPAKFGGVGGIRTLYFIILASHIILAAVIVPMALITIYRSFTTQYLKHKKIARITFPIWLYVAVTGVVVYLMMHPYYPN